MKIALIGFPQAGKKSLFRLLTGRDVPAGRRPDEVVDGLARIRDPRVDRLADICRPQKTTYAENHFVLCPDANTDGSARSWLDAARQCDLLCLVVRAFEDESVYHPAGSVNAARDRQSLEDELLLADMAMVETRLTRMAKETRVKKTSDGATEAQTLEKALAALSEGTRLDALDLAEHELASVASLGFLTLIPLLYTYNVSEDDLQEDFGERSLTISARIEEEIASMDDAESAEYLEAIGLDASGVDRVNAAAYDAVGLMSFYTIGADEVRAWTIRKGSSAPVAGGKIHTDIQRGFIRVEVIKYNDLIDAGTEQAAKERGRMQLRGKDYIMEDGDICHFLFNV